MRRFNLLPSSPIIFNIQNPEFTKTLLWSKLLLELKDCGFEILDPNLINMIGSRVPHGISINQKQGSSSSSSMNRFACFPSGYSFVYFFLEILASLFNRLHFKLILPNLEIDNYESIKALLISKIEELAEADLQPRKLTNERPNAQSPEPRKNSAIATNFDHLLEASTSRDNSST